MCDLGSSGEVSIGEFDTYRVLQFLGWYLIFNDKGAIDKGEHVAACI
jgi:hypothetical protein